MDLERDWSKLTNEEGVQILRNAMGTSPFAPPPRLQAGYVITVDNLLKMLSVSLRMKYSLPVLVMGETGCGKSSLMKATCAILGWYVLPSRIPFLCTRSTRAGIEWCCRHRAVCMARPREDPHHSGRAVA